MASYTVIQARRPAQLGKLVPPAITPVAGGSTRTEPPRDLRNRDRDDAKGPSCDRADQAPEQ